MKNETKKKLKNLEKHLKICPDCGKEFLPIIIDCSPDVHIYNFKCNKCFKCAEKCCDKYSEYINDDLIEKLKQLKCPEGIWGDWYAVLPCYELFSVYKENDCNSIGINLLEFFKEEEVIILITEKTLVGTIKKANGTIKKVWEKYE